MTPPPASRASSSSRLTAPSSAPSRPAHRHPWWQDIAPVIDAVRAAHGIEVVVLRALEIAPNPKSVKVTYLAEVAGPVEGVEPWDGELDEHPCATPTPSWAAPQRTWPGPAPSWRSRA
uniref:Uncharacterized protein n=1 Tax=Phenylobacterium glaciei TaxID=2803784 RepID=A0A974S6X4_9CAUL|nr:hypothetical protein JKL49_15590 [Phenylobacterium glaciei]